MPRDQSNPRQQMINHRLNNGRRRTALLSGSPDDIENAFVCHDPCPAGTLSTRSPFYTLTRPLPPAHRIPAHSTTRSVANVKELFSLPRPDGRTNGVAGLVPVAVPVGAVGGRSGRPAWSRSKSTDGLVTDDRVCQTGSFYVGRQHGPGAVLSTFLLGNGSIVELTPAPLREPTPD
jgi:hypothetical protein